MIGYLKGLLVDVSPAMTYMDVGGVGYEVQISLNTYNVIQNKEACKLFTYVHVREDAWTMFGFATLEEKEAFLKLISVSGVGTNTARIMLSSLTTRDLYYIISNGDNKALEKVKGIGPKTAQMIILQLKGKINVKEIEGLDKVGGEAHNTMTNDALNALVALGIPKPTATAALKKVVTTAGVDLKLEELIKEALKNL